MPIKSITSDYTGRKKDLDILQHPDASIPGAQNVTPTFTMSGRFCAGVQKLIQRYAIILLTDITSQQYYPNFGTTFMPRLNASSSVDRILARQIFTMASAVAVQTIKNYQIYKKDIPADERIVSASLEKIVVDAKRGGISFDVAISTEAGSVIDFLLPLPK
jgi:hypothetical protein